MWPRLQNTATGLLCLSTLALGLTSPLAGALPLDTHGPSIDRQCTEQGRDPATPFADNSCFLCHDSGNGGPGDGRLAYQANNLDFFCQVADVEPPEPDNQAPELSPIGDKSGGTEVELTFEVSASDPDGDNLILSASDLPTGADFTDNTDGTGVFTWTPDDAQTGTFSVTFTATDDGDPVETDAETIDLVIGVDNNPPVLEPIGPQAVDLNQQLEFTLSASDPDNDNVAFSSTALPTGAVLTDNEDGTALFTWTPDANQEGNQIITFTATDDGDPVASDSEEVVISAGDVNRPPELAAVGNQSVEVGEELNLIITATDPDGDAIALSADSLPTGADLIDNGDNTGAFIWTPTAADVGTHSIALTASDDGDPVETDSEEIVVTVVNIGDVGNSPPVLNSIGNRIVSFDETLSLAISATDPDGGNLTFSAGTLPDGATLTDNGNGTAELTYTPSQSDIGNRNVTITVTDDGTPAASDQETFTLTVDDGSGVNRPPSLDRIGFHVIKAGETLKLQLRATDPNGDSISFYSFGVPETAELTDNGDGTATFTWTPTNSEVGLHPLTVAAMDSGTPVEGDAEFTFIEVEAGEGGEEEEPVEENPNLVITLARVYGKDLLSIKGVYNGISTNGRVEITDADTGEDVGTATMNGLGTWRLVTEVDDVPCEVLIRSGADSVQERLVGGACF